MKFLVLAAAVCHSLAAPAPDADAGLHTLHHAVPAVHAAAPVVHAVPAVHAGYHGPIHIPHLVAHPNGAVTPVDEPAVAAARADHLAAHGGHAGHAAYAAPAHAGHAAYAAPVHAGHHASVVSHHAGHPASVVGNHAGHPAYAAVPAHHHGGLVSHPNGNRINIPPSLSPSTLAFVSANIIVAFLLCY